ncbi:MAG TPA: transporter [Chryseolinea sp.]
MKYIMYSLCIVASSLLSQFANAQDPILPATNLGLTNITDAFVPAPGAYFMYYTQVYDSRRLTNGSGDKIPTDLQIGSFLNVAQLVYLTKTKVAGGNLGFTTLVPIVKLSADSPSGVAPTVNPGVMGDIIFGAAIQWMDKKFLNKTLYHRTEFSATLPLGSYDKNYEINASSNLYTFSAYHSFTYFLTEQWSISMRNTLNYNTRIRDTEIRPGAFFTSNFSIERTVYKSLRIALVGYLLGQIEEDSYASDHDFYEDQYGIGNTKERVLGIGPGVSYLSPTGLFVEGKVFFETIAENRFEGLPADTARCIQA